MPSLSNRFRGKRRKRLQKIIASEETPGDLFNLHVDSRRRQQRNKSQHVINHGVPQGRRG